SGMNVAKTTPPQAAEERRAEGVCQIEARFCSMIEPMVVGEGHETPKPGLAPGLSTAKPEARPPPTDRAVDRHREYTLDPIHKNLTPTHKRPERAGDPNRRLLSSSTKD
ncbi:hypothetical protein PtrEW13061_012274, partial [Pyrenophora tritici-repentis]